MTRPRSEYPRRGPDYIGPWCKPRMALDADTRARFMVLTHRERHVVLFNGRCRVLALYLSGMIDSRIFADRFLMDEQTVIDIAVPMQVVWFVRFIRDRGWLKSKLGGMGLVYARIVEEGLQEQNQIHQAVPGEIEPGRTTAYLRLIRGYWDRQRRGARPPGA